MATPTSIAWNPVTALPLVPRLESQIYSEWPIRQTLTFGASNFQVGQNSSMGGNCYYAAISMLIYGHNRWWMWIKGHHRTYFNRVLNNPAHPRYDRYQRLNNLPPNQTIQQRLDTPRQWTDTAICQVTADLYQLHLIWFDVTTTPISVSSAGQRNARQKFLLFTGNHFEPMHPIVPQGSRISEFHWSHFDAIQPTNNSKSSKRPNPFGTTQLETPDPSPNKRPRDESDDPATSNNNNKKQKRDNDPIDVDSDSSDDDVIFTHVAPVSTNGTLRDRRRFVSLSMNDEIPDQLSPPPHIPELTILDLAVVLGITVNANASTAKWADTAGGYRVAFNSPNRSYAGDVGWRNS